MGVSFKGTEKGFLDFLTLVNEGQCSVSAPKQKGKREVKNLEYSFNFDARGVGLAGLKSRGSLLFCKVAHVLWVLWVFVVGLGVSSIFWVFSGVLPLFSVFLLFWCPCTLPICAFTLFNAISFFTYKKKSVVHYIENQGFSIYLALQQRLYYDNSFDLVYCICRNFSLSGREILL
jgi:hypothetical protein